MSEELDNDFVSESEYPFRETLRWWERRRIWYNLVVVAMQVIMIWSFWDAVVFTGLNRAIIISIIFLFMANISFCLGWGIEFLIAFYWKSKKSRPPLRRTLFILGTVFSVPFTYIYYLDIYWFYLFRSI